MERAHAGHNSQTNDISWTCNKDELEKVVLTGYVEGTRDRGKQRETFLMYLSKHKGIQPSEMIRQTIDRDIWIQLCRTQQSTSKVMTLSDDDVM